ncbi:hypothetical protein EMIT0P265_120016 [Pseudomonas zeae]
MCSAIYRLSVAVVWNLHSREAVAVRVKLSFTPPVCKPGLRSGGLEAISSHQGCDTLNSHDYVSAPIAVPALDGLRPGRICPHCPGIAGCPVSAPSSKPIEINSPVVGFTQQRLRGRCRAR